MADDTGLVGHWRLAGDCADASGLGNHGINHGVDLDAIDPSGREGSAARFDGRGSFIEVADRPSLHLGSSGFAISLWVHTESSLDGLLGDLISKYDPTRRMGFTLGLLNHAGVASNQANHRHLHLGTDNRMIESAWTDHGRPGNAIMVFGLAVCEGSLYAGTCEAGANERGHVYRWDGGAGWVDCGIPIACNAVRTLAVHEGHLYAGVGAYDPRGSGLGESPNTMPGGHVYRYEGGLRWTDCGQPAGPTTALVSGLVIFRGRLHARADGGLYRYEGGAAWTALGHGGGYVLAPFNGHLYTNGGIGGGQNQPVVGMFRHDDEAGWTPCGTPENTVQIYSIAVHEGDLYIGTWPTATVFRWDGGEGWIDCGRLGDELEVMGMMVYNGKLYAGTLPRAEVYRYEGGVTWTRTGQLDTTPDVLYRRAWSMATFQGRLFCGTLPSGRVYSLEAGKSVTHDLELATGWRHIAAVKDGDLLGCRLRLYVDGDLVATSTPFNQGEVYISNHQPLRIGAGPQASFNGRLAEVRLYNRALTPAEVADLARAERAG